MIASLSALIAAIVSDKRRKESARQRQLISGNGVGLQAGGDISVEALGVELQAHARAITQGRAACPDSPGLGWPGLGDRDSPFRGLYFREVPGNGWRQVNGRRAGARE